MVFRRRAATMGKVKVPDARKEEVGLSFYYSIVHKVTRHKVSPSLIMDLGHTPSKLVPESKVTHGKIGPTTLLIAGSTEKKASTLTYVIALNRAFLPIQAIYKGKTTRSFPRVEFPESFCLSFNEKHWGNEKESLKIIEDIIVPYVTKEREKLFSPNQPEFLTMDIFKGQMTNPVLKKLEEHNILLTGVPGNMAHLFQPLDLTVNSYFKQLMKQKVADWYGNINLFFVDYFICCNFDNNVLSSCFVSCVCFDERIVPFISLKKKLSKFTSIR